MSFNVYRRFSTTSVPVAMFVSRIEAIIWCENQEPEEEDISWAQTYRLEEYPKSNEWRYSKEPKPRSRKKSKVEDKTEL